jgi:hypothetical protein
VVLIAPRTARVVAVDDATLRAWSERGITRLPLDEVAWMRASEDDTEEITHRLRRTVRAGDEGYELRGPIIFSDDENHVARR